MNPASHNSEYMTTTCTHVLDVYQMPDLTQRHQWNTIMDKNNIERNTTNMVKYDDNGDINVPVRISCSMLCVSNSTNIICIQKFWM